MNDAIIAAGERLREVLRTGLSEQGFADDLEVRLQEGGVIIASRSSDVAGVEFGRPGTPPMAVMGNIARESALAVVEVLANHLRSREL